MVPIPPELLRTARLDVGQEVELTAEAGRLTITPAGVEPDPDLVEFAARFTGRYRYALEELARSSR
jgi:antitoxin component of MazEF toxin-antitoxin module